MTEQQYPEWVRDLLGVIAPAAKRADLPRVREAVGELYWTWTGLYESDAAVPAELRGANALVMQLYNIVEEDEDFPAEAPLGAALPEIESMIRSSLSQT